MKKFSCVLLSAFIMLCLAACSNNEMKLYAGYCTYYPDGGIIDFSEYSYEYDTEGNLLNEYEYHNGYLYTSKERKYDKSGSFTESVYDSADKLKSLNEYDAGEIIRKETQYGSDGDIDMIIDYNEKGLMIRKESLDMFQYIVEYEYDESGNLTRKTETDFDDNGNPDNYYEFTYDSDGEEIQQTVTSPYGYTSVDSRSEKIADGNKITINTYGPFDDLRYITERQYDTYGNLIKDITYKVTAGEKEELTSKEYKYDSENRVIDYIYKFTNTTETKYEYSAEGYLEKESIITQRWISPEVFSDGSDAILTECVTVNYYNADGDITKSESIEGGLLGSYTEYYYENVTVKSGSKFDFRDSKRKLDPRTMIVY